jgi:hypothetical protein
MNISNPECNNTHASSDSIEHEIDEVVSAFIDSTKNLAEDLGATDDVLSDFVDSAEGLASLVRQTAKKTNTVDERATENSADIGELEQDLDDEKDKRSASIEGVHNRVSSVEDQITASNPTPQAEKTNAQAGDLTPIEQLSQADDIDEVTDSQSVQRAVSIFKNIDNWGCRTPKGIVLKPADNPLSLLEADQDESLAWKQYYRAAEALEQLSQGSATFFHSDKHGRIICLHSQSEAYQRVVEGELTPSSVEATT